MFQKYVCTLGMVQFMKYLLKEDRLPHQFSTLPKDVKEVFSFSCSYDYNSISLQITCGEEGVKGHGNFFALYCM